MATELNIEENVALAPLTTLRIGGPARRLIRINQADQLAPVLHAAAVAKWPVAVIGGGSNVLISDQGWDGLVILMQNQEKIWAENKLTVGAGLTLGQFISVAMEHGRGGLSWLVGVPGTVGGAVYGNVGSRQWGIGQYVAKVWSVDRDGKITARDGSACEFSYRHSLFQNGQEIIIRIAFDLPVVDATVERKLLSDAAAKKRAAQPLTAASAGCVFVNPAVPAGAKLPAELRGHVEPDGTIAAWRLIAAADLAGRNIGGIQISTQHANFMVNTGAGTADQMVQLISYVKQQIRDRFGIQLNEEIKYLGF